MNFLKQKTGPLPNWAWGAIIVVGMGIGIFVMRRMNSGSSAPASEEIPIEYQPASQGYEPMSGGNGHEVIIIPLGNYTPPPQDIQRSREPVRTETETKTIAHIRDRGLFQEDRFKTGVPVRRGTASGTGVIGEVPFGSDQSVIGGSLKGDAVKTPEPYADVNALSTWFQLAKGGYISAVDVKNVETVTVQKNTSGTSGNEQTNVSNSGNATQSNSSSQTQSNG